jgi:hypothetical protein
MSFSKRNGHPCSDDEAIGLQIGGMNKRLRTALWNASLSRLFGQLSANSNGLIVQDYHVFIALWRQFFCLPMDDFPRILSDRRDTFRDFFETAEWNRIYDFLEAAAGRMTAHDADVWCREINAALEQECAGYRMVGRCIIPLGENATPNLINDAIDVLTTYEWKPVHQAVSKACAIWSALKTARSGNDSEEMRSPSHSQAPAANRPLKHAEHTFDPLATAAVDVLASALDCASALRSHVPHAPEGEVRSAGPEFRITENADSQGAANNMDAVLAAAEALTQCPKMSWSAVQKDQILCTARTLQHSMTADPDCKPQREAAPNLQHAYLIGFATHTALLILDQCVRTGLVSPRDQTTHRPTVPDPWGERRVGK